MKIIACGFAFLFPLLSVFALVVGLGGCDTIADEDEAHLKPLLLWNGFRGEIYEFHDEVHMVTCWGASHALSCLPDSQIAERSHR